MNSTKLFVNGKKGPLAEWLGKALQKLLQRFESARDLSKNKACKDLLISLLSFVYEI